MVSPPHPPPRPVIDLAASLPAALGLDALAERIVDQLTPLLGGERSAVYLLDEDTGELWSRSAQRAQSALRLPPGKGIVGWVAQSRRPARVDDPYADPRYVRAWDQASGLRARSLVAAPLVSPAGQLVGVVACADKPGGFTAEDEAVLMGLAPPIARAVEHALLVGRLEAQGQALARSEAALRAAIDELHLVYELERVLACIRGEEAALTAVLERLRGFLDASAAVGVLVGADGAHLVTARAEGTDTRSMSADEAAELVDRFSGRRVRPLLPAGDRAKTHVIAAPIEIDGVRIGGLQVYLRGRKDKPGRQDLISLAAARLGAALGAARERALRERDDRLATVGQMMSGIVHDLRGPMSAALGYTDLLTDEPDPDQREHLAKQVRTALRQIDEMAQEILQFARGDTEIVVQPIELGRFLRSVEDQLRPDLDQFGTTVGFEGDTAGLVRFDIGKIRRVVANLARNAGQAGARRVVVRIARDPATLVIRVEDDGPGIPDEVKGRLFQPFATYGKKGGTGLGLAMARRIVEAHAGRLELASTGRGGTVFELVLPSEPTGGAPLL